MFALNTQGSLKLKFQVTVRRISHYFSSFQIGRNRVPPPHSRACGNVMSINTTRGNYGASSVIEQRLWCIPAIYWRLWKCPSFHSFKEVSSLLLIPALCQIHSAVRNSFCSWEYLLQIPSYLTTTSYHSTHLAWTFLHFCWTHQWFFL